MEIFMTNVGPSTTKNQVASHIARILHSPGYAQHSSSLLNFDVYLFRDKRPGARGHSGKGALTLPSVEVGVKFLQESGGINPRNPLIVDRKRIRLEKSRRIPRTEVVESIRRLPYLDPMAIAERERKAAELEAESVAVRTLQFGWECRDSVFSVEWEQELTGTCSLSFEDERREMRIKIHRPTETHVVAMRFSQVLWTGCSSSSGQPVIFISLATPPAFESETPLYVAQQIHDLLGLFSNKCDVAPRQRLSSLDAEHARIVQYTSHSIRLVCSSRADISLFRRLSGIAQLHGPQDFDYPIERRGRFSALACDEFQRWLRFLDWQVAFQVQSLVQNLLVDVKEMLELKPLVERIIDEMGTRFASAFLRHFAADAKLLFWQEESHEIQRESILECFERSEGDFRKTQAQSLASIPSDGVYDCLHVTITPTTMILEGPFPERSNRVIRMYPGNEDSFIRVSFVDENRLQYRFDREVDGTAFIKRRVGGALRNGLLVAGRSFRFLAYSQSALKEHAVIFVTPFYDNHRHYIDAPTIIQGLGSFRDLQFDPSLIYCPARYGARVSQAFTATDSSVSVEAEEIIYQPDIENDDGHDRHCFTDGVGTISPELARDIWLQLRSAGRRAGRTKTYPRSFQVRFMGSKGMLSVDYQLSGRAICLRPSMIKFEAPESRGIEIARAFDRPGKYYLNRPLIMILEGLGVPCSVFQRYQDAAVLEAQESVESLINAAHFLDAYGLGASFRLNSVMLSLNKLTYGGSCLDDVFYQQMMEFAINHVLRELKQHARIPIPEGWTLVGVADIHRFLQPGQIFACVKSPDSHKITYIEGPILISRSPTIHPGDVQVAQAIGKPPPGSCFANEPLPNTVVFSVMGDRPLPSCLGGGDLDGDVYNLIPLRTIPDFRPSRSHQAASYDPAPKKLLDRPSTMEDVADFVVDYIISDVLGIIAINWLIIADQSSNGIFDADCMTLSRLHSDAVDYPKSGKPVALGVIPKLKFRAKPDWNAPETISSSTANYYQSSRAIGRLFRAIDLPALRTVKKTERSQRRQLREENEFALEEIMESLRVDDGHRDPMRQAVEERVAQYISPDEIDDEMVIFVSQLFNRYASELRTICSAHTLSPGRSAMLTEEEAVVGTIVAKCSQPRKRKDMMTKLREQTDILVRTIREELTAEDDEPLEEWVMRTWVAWELATAMQDSFGAKSFGWIALGGVFEAIKAIEDDEKGY